MHQQARARAVVASAMLGVAAVPVLGHAGTVQVVAATSDVGAVVQAVGGERVRLQTLARGYFDPHHLEAKPSYMVALRKADLLVFNGLQLEIGWLPLLIQGARNRNIVFGAAGNLALSHGIEVLEVPEHVDRAEGDIHPEGNPHYTLDPRNLRIMAMTVEQALARIDPDGAPFYTRQRTEFIARLDAALAVWEARLAPVRGRKIVCYHKQWEYLLAWVGIEAIGYIENKPGVPPSPRHIEELETLMKQRDVEVVLASTFVNAKAAERVAERTGARLLVLPAAVGAVDSVDDPFALFEHLTSALQRAFESRGAG